MTTEIQVVSEFESEDPGTIEAWARLSRDLKKAASQLSRRQATYLVDTYYQIQQVRISAASQARQAVEAEEPAEFLAWLGLTTRTLEGSIRSALKAYASAQLPGRWAMSIVGIGPVIAAGLLAHIDASKARTAGAVWRFAGLDPTAKWEKGQKRPWNAALKVLCWKLGESFVKVHNREGDVYGKLYSLRKQQETERNLAGMFSDQAARTLAEKKFRKQTIARTAYESGQLPAAHVHARAKRWAVKIFLAHYHHVAYQCEHGEPPPKPYVIDVLGHGDYMSPPNWPMA